MTQFSLFGATVADPTLADLDGVLLAGGQWVRASDGTARLSVVVADRWRAEALVDEFALREVAVADDQAAITDAEAGLGVRTGFHPALAADARRWTRGASLAPPADLALTARGLRLWVIAVGRDTETGYLLGTDGAGGGDGAIHRAAGAQLSAIGVAAVSITQRGGPGWRVTSVRRVRRLAELVGPGPGGAGRDWPRTG